MAMQKGTCNNFAIDLAKRVFPVPVSPTKIILDFSISKSSIDVSG